ncbi:hypothetical protein SAMN05192544_104467 [Paraburkholderia hospita]|nr:hypothetical protein SAMN05192544_104467 [Paraburkholderia hospita]
MLLRFANPASALALTLLFEACAPAVNAPPVTPTVGWQIRDETIGAVVPVTTVVSGQEQADGVGRGTFSVAFNANSSGGIGSGSTSGSLDALSVTLWAGSPRGPFASSRLRP